LLIDTGAPKSDFHNLNVNLRFQITTPKNLVFDRSFIQKRLEARDKAISSAIRRLETYHYEAISKQLGQRVDKQWFLKALRKAAGTRSQGNSRTEKEDYERSLRERDWTIDDPTVPKNGPPL